MASDLVTKIVLTSIIVNLVFPVFAYSFTTITGEDLEDYDISLDYDDLLRAGLLFQDAQSYNLTFHNEVVFNVSDRLIRARWDTRLGAGDVLRFSVPTIAEKGIGAITGYYFSLGGKTVYLTLETTNEFLEYLYNSTIIVGLDPEYNWTRVNLDTGQIALITPPPEANGNMTKAVYELGKITITLGDKAMDQNDVDVIGFVDWYFSFVLGSRNYGWPASLAWIMRIWAVITFFSGMYLAVSLLRGGS